MKSEEIVMGHIMFKVVGGWHLGISKQLVSLPELAILCWILPLILDRWWAAARKSKYLKIAIPQFFATGWDGDMESRCRRASWLLQLHPAVCSRRPDQPHLLHGYNSDPPTTHGPSQSLKMQTAKNHGKPSLIVPIGSLQLWEQPAAPAECL